MRWVAVVVSVVALTACSSSSKSAAPSWWLATSCKGAIANEYSFGGLNAGEPSIVAKPIERQTVLVCGSRAEWLAAAKAVKATFSAEPDKTGITSVTGVSQERHGPAFQNTSPENLLTLFCKKYGPAPACG